MTNDLNSIISQEVESLKYAIERAGFLKGFHKDRIKSYLRSQTYDERTYIYIHLKPTLLKLKIPFSEQSIRSENGEIPAQILDISSLISMSSTNLIYIYEEVTLLDANIMSDLENAQEILNNFNNI